jgi:peptidoglycan/xylan/chitin deacetylase (PgdA/CDA1 family)
MPSSLCRADKVLLAGGAAVLGSSALLTATPLAITSAAFLMVLTDGIFRPASSVLYPTIWHGPRDRPRVALTFDDGPDPQVTPSILDALGDAGARATFFAIGRHLEKHRDVAARALREGHELGNHSWMHSYFQNFYRTRRQRMDVDRSTRLIQELSGSTVEPLYRSPVGLKSPAIARVAHARSLKVIAWSLHSRDTFTRDPEKVAALVLSRITPGDIVLMHDGHEREGTHRTVAAAALPSILRGLRERGLSSVSVSELLGTTAPPANLS